MSSFIRAENDITRFSFPALTAAMQRNATGWFSERLAELSNDRLRLRVAKRLFLQVEPHGLNSALNIEFAFSFLRTLRVPDDGKEYPLPAGLGRLPVRSIRTLKSPAIPPAWRQRRTGIVPMHPTEATWLSFQSRQPFAVQIATGGICAVSGEVQANRLSRTPQNYVSVPTQPWLDGFRVGPKTVRQFVAMPLGHAYTVEGQVTGVETRGGVQVRVVPLRQAVLWRDFVEPRCEDIWERLTREETVNSVEESAVSEVQYCKIDKSYGLGAGGRIRQEIYADPQKAEDWDEAAAVDCEIHLIPAAQWPEFTGEPVPTKPPTPADYASSGIPWFDYECDAAPLTTGAPLAAVASVNTVFKQKSGLDLPDNDPMEPDHIVMLGESVSASDVEKN